MNMKNIGVYQLISMYSKLATYLLIKIEFTRYTNALI